MSEDQDGNLSNPPVGKPPDKESAAPAQGLAALLEELEEYQAEFPTEPECPFNRV